MRAGSDDIWIAAGTYTPTVPLDGSTPRTATFYVDGTQDGLKIYGGFASGDTFADRDPATKVTVLSGDLNGDDGPDTDGDGIPDSNRGDNAYHVLVLNGGEGIGADVTANITEATVIDGVTVSGGNADDGGSFSSPDRKGGGIYCDGQGDSNACSPQIIGTTFVGNSADQFGGAIYNNGSRGTSSPQITGATFSGNHASTSGGAIYNDGTDGASSPQITNVTFTGNSANNSGGAIRNNGRDGASSPRITNAIFTGNSAGTSGGAIYNYGRDGVSSPVITNAAFAGNAAVSRGGAIYSNGFSGTSSPQVTSTTFTGNSAGDGGAIYNDGFNGGTSSPKITNVILWGNSATGDGDEIYNRDATPTLSYTLVEGLNPSGTGNLDGTDPANAPRFVDADGPDGAFGTLDDDVRLALGSPAIGVGDNTALPADIADLDGDGDTAEPIPFDLLGEARIQDGTVSLGAYERGVDVAWLNLVARPGAESSTFELINRGSANVTGAEVGLGLPTGVSITGDSGNGGVTDGTWTVDVPAGDTATVRVDMERDASVDPGLLTLVAELDTVSYAVDGGASDLTRAEDAAADWALLEAPYGPGTALAFGGSSDGATAGADPVVSGNAPWTISFWANVDGSQSGTGRHWYLWKGPNSQSENRLLAISVTDGAVEVAHWANDYTYNADVAFDTWQHVAVTYDGKTTEKVYLDGVLQEERDVGPLNVNDGPWSLAQRPDGEDPIQMEMDELRIWSEARSEDQIQATMHQTISADTPGLVASYRFDAAQTGQRLGDSFEGTTAYDLTGGRNATFVGDPQWTESGASLGQESVVVEANGTGAVGPTNAQLTVTNTDAPVTLYRYGAPSAAVFADDGIPKEGRSNAVWGVVPVGEPTSTADLELTYGDVTVPNPSAVGLAERPRPAQPWTIRAEEPSAETFELIGQTESREFTLYDAEPIIYYVNAGANSAGGTGSGLSWDNAFTGLQDGLNAATGRDVIVIAAGTYLPSNQLDGSDPRTATFEITGDKDGLRIYGGFNGSEPFNNVSDIDAALDGRNLSVNETILSGDLNADDGPDTDGDGIPDSGRGDNAYHVLIFDGGNRIGADVSTNITRATVLDGVTITGGNADGSFPYTRGGGLNCDGQGTDNVCSPQVTRTVFAGNSARDGGGIYNDGTEGGTSSPRITGSTFAGNVATGFGTNVGGAIYNSGRGGGTSSPQITRSTFTGNSANDRGGAIYNDGDGGTSSPQITGSVFTSNSVTNGLSLGGAIGNEGASGGTSSPQITGSTFTENAAVGAGGAIYNEGSSGGTSSTQITSSTFTGNSGGSFGGAIASFGSDFGGGEGTISPKITGSTFTSNSADSGGAIANASGEGSPVITNSILWGNSASNGSEISNFGPNTTLTLSHTLIQGGINGTNGVDENEGSSTVEDGPIFEEDPLFVDAAAGDVRLQAGSPAIARGTFAPFEAGGIAEGIPTDLAGNARIFGARPDLGAYAFNDIAANSNEITDASSLLGYLEPAEFEGLVLLRKNPASSGGLTFTRTEDAPEDPSGEELPDNVAPFTWTVTSGLNEDPTYDLIIDVSTLSGIGAFEELMLYKSDDGGQTWNAVDTFTGASLVLDEDRQLVAVQDLEGFSQFAIASTDASNPLPVELAGLQAQRTGENAVTVQWETLSETNNAGFDVQRRAVSATGFNVDVSRRGVSTRGSTTGASTTGASTTGASWTSIATMGGAGTTDTPQSYRFTDTDLPYAADSLSYRLRQIDADGSASFSKAVTIARPVEAAELMPTYPNPARSTATVRFAVLERQAVRITLYDLLGRRVQTVVDTEVEGRTEQVLDVSRLASGTYFLRMQTEAGPVDTQRITVVR